MWRALQAAVCCICASISSLPREALSCAGPRSARWRCGSQRPDEAPCRRIDLDNCPRCGAVEAECRQGTDNGIAPQRSCLDGRAILHGGDERDHAAFDEIDMFDALLRFLQHAIPGAGDGRRANL